MKPLFPYPGGKSKLLKSILPFVPNDAKTYVEPFAGGLAVMLSRDVPFPKEVANDLDSGLVDFYRMAAAHPEAIIEELSGYFASREEFDNEVRFPFGKTELGRAASWYWRQKQSFGGKRLHFGRGRDSFRGFDKLRDGDAIREFSSRAKNVEFVCGDASSAIRAFDSEDTFFFVDPPYVECAKTAYDAFSEQDMARLRDVLLACRGRWLLTCDDSASTRRVFSGFFAIENKIRYSLSKDKVGKVSGELMVFSPRLAKEHRRAPMIIVEETEMDFQFFDDFFLAI